jgi:HlyD family secretion protein
VFDRADVYMTVFLPAHDAGGLTLGDDARVTLDPVLGCVFPAKVTFVATEAQFTPKSAETPEEREKLMFRVKLTIDPALRTRYEDAVKIGVRGLGPEILTMMKSGAWTNPLSEFAEAARKELRSLA